MNTKDFVVHARLSAEQYQWLETICAESGMSQSQVIRLLVEKATFRPAVIRTEAPENKREQEAV